MRWSEPSNDAEACKLTPCGNHLRAATGRSQASAPRLSSLVDSTADKSLASELTGLACPRKVA